MYIKKIYCIIMFLLLFQTILAIEITCDNCTDCSTKITTANSGDIIRLTQDILNSNVNNCINLATNNITFDGQSHIIEGNNVADYGIYLYRATWATKTNVTITNLTVKNWDSANIYVRYATHNKITYIKSYNSTDYGIKFEHTGSNVFNNSELKDNNILDFTLFSQGSGFCQNTIQNIIGSGDREIKYVKSKVNLQDQTYSQLFLCDADYSNLTNVKIIGSNIKKNNGLQLLSTSNTHIINLDSSNNYEGIYFFESSLNTLYNVTTNNNSNDGIQIGYLNGNSFTYITSNNNGASGIRFEYDVTSNTIQNSTFNNNQYGATIRHSSNNIIKYNQIFNNSINGLSADLLGNVNKNLIYNNFLNNSNNINFISTIYNNSWNTSLIGNFWSNPIGTGFSQVCINRGDGICDTQYNLSGDNKNIDYLPMAISPIIITSQPILESSSNQTKNNDYIFSLSDSKQLFITSVLIIIYLIIS